MFAFVCILGLIVAVSGQIPEGETHTNSIGMEFVRINAGSFTMGYDGTTIPEDVAGKPWRTSGDTDERPVHEVSISQPFFMGAVEVTNAQFEAYDPAHKALRGKLEFSTDDDEAVVFVSWHDAVAFCEWLAKKEGLPYRLPTEAEWEYACRASTRTLFSMGDALPAEYLQNPGQSWYPDPERSADSPVIALHVGKTAPNPWGLYDMHGNVEEWCLDWYGPYVDGPQKDPVGRIDGNYHVARGGSHSTEPYYLRSANRTATVPEDRNWVIGFRVVIGEMPATQPLPVELPKRWQEDVVQERPSDSGARPESDVPYFRGPQKYVHIPADASGPIFAKHNHCPALVECPNGDLLAIWYSCVEERGRELCIVASRLRYGRDEWDEAEMFWDAPDRNDHASALWFDGDKTLYHFNGLSVAATWGNLATVMRTSTDNGVTWSKARIIIPEHGLRHMPIESVFRTKEGAILLPCDAVTGGNGGSAIHLSYDRGQTWTAPGGTIAGIHAGVAQLGDGRLMALGRGDTIDERMPKSISSDMGKTWTVGPSEFPPISGGQRLVLTRLQEGPLFFASFAQEVPFTDAMGAERVGTGLFGALSFDDGATWPIRRLITDDGAGRQVEAMDGNLFPMDGDHAEPKGYLSVCQGADGTIHLISSRQHYAFNLAWLKTPPPPPFLENGVTAHRGDSLAFPENTMSAFESAIALGADWIECDVYRTKDGKLVVIHDETTERVGDSNVVVAETTWEDLGKIDVTHGFRVEHGLSLEECPRQRIPLLSEVITLLKGQHRTRLSIQPKADVVDDCIAVVQTMNAEPWIGFNDMDLAKMSRVKALAPSLSVFWDRPEALDVAGDINIAKEHGFEALVVHWKGMTPEVASAIDEAGLEAGVWTVNDEATLARLDKIGVKRVYTDIPQTLLELRSGG